MLIDIPLNKGFASAEGDSYSIPPGYVRTTNLDYRDDGTLQPRYRLDMWSDTERGSCRGLFCRRFNGFGGVFYIGGDGKVYFRPDINSPWQTPQFQSEYPASIGANLEIDWLQYEPDKIIFKPKTNDYTAHYLYKESGVWKWNYLYAADGSLLKGLCVGTDENRVLAGAEYHNRIRYSTIGNCTSGYQDNWVECGARGEKIKYIFASPDGHWIIKEGSIWRKVGVIQDGLHAYQYKFVMECQQVITAKPLMFGSFAILTDDGIFLVSEQGVSNIGVPVWAEIRNMLNQENLPIPSIHYVPNVHQIWLSFPNSNTILAYRMQDKRWVRHSDMKILYSSYNHGGSTFFGCKDDEWIYKMDRYPNFYEGECTLETGWITPPKTGWMMDNYLHRVFIWAKNVNTITIYGREDPFDVQESVIKEISSDTCNFKHILHIPARTKWKQIRLKLVGNKMAVSKLAIDYESRREG